MKEMQSERLEQSALQTCTLESELEKVCLTVAELTGMMLNS